MATQNQKVLAKHGADKNVFCKEVTVTMTDGAAVAGTFDLPPLPLRTAPERQCALFQA